MSRSPTLGSASAILQEILVTSARVGNNYMMRSVISTTSLPELLFWLSGESWWTYLQFSFSFLQLRQCHLKKGATPREGNMEIKGNFLLFVSVIYWYPKRASSITTYCDRSNGKVINGIYIGPRFLTYERPGRWLRSVTDLLRVLALTVLSINHPY